MSNLTKNEKLLLVDSYNGIMIDSLEKPGVPNEYVIDNIVADVKDSIDFEKLDKKWSVDSDALILKLSSMDNEGKVKLLQNIHDYWNINKRDWVSS